MFLTLLLHFFLLFYSPTNSHCHDRYGNYFELMVKEQLGVDYTIHSSHTGHPLTIFVIHGGTIEEGTSSLGATLAAEVTANLYIFEGLKPAPGAWDLHLTSTRFDEPVAIAMANASETCVSIHSFWDVDPDDATKVIPGKPRLCFGGLNDELKQVLYQKFSRVLPAEFLDSASCAKFPGTHPENIVNRCQQHGVQLEFSRELFGLMASNKRLMHDLQEAFRLGVDSYFIRSKTCELTSIISSVIPSISRLPPRLEDKPYKSN